MKTFVGFKLEDDALVNYGCVNITYHYMRYVFNEGNLYDIVFVFLEPFKLPPLNIRVYGLGGFAPEHEVLALDYRFVRLHLKNISSEKVLITFNEEKAGEIQL